MRSGLAGRPARRRHRAPRAPLGPRSSSIDFLLDAGLSETDATIETDRYIGWPGQALAYMIGRARSSGCAREIAAARRRRFDLRAFHDQVLGHGSLPLATLAARAPELGRDPGLTADRQPAARIRAATSGWPARSASSAAVRMSTL